MSYVGVTNTYVGDNKSYVGLTFSYKGVRTALQCGEKQSYVGHISFHKIYIYSIDYL